MNHKILPRALICRIGTLSVKRKNGLLYLMFCLILLGGMVCGALSERTADRTVLQRLDLLFLTNLDLRTKEGALWTFVSSFASNMIFLIILVLLGLSLWGSLMTVMVPFFKGYGYGLSIGFLYGTYGMKGAGYHLLVILPGSFLSSAVIAAAALFSFRHSLSMAAGSVFSPVREDPAQRLAGYMRSMIRMLILCACAAAADMIFSLFFSGLFSF